MAMPQVDEVTVVIIGRRDASRGGPRPFVLDHAIRAPMLLGPKIDNRLLTDEERAAINSTVRDMQQDGRFMNVGPTAAEEAMAQQAVGRERAIARCTGLVERSTPLGEPGRPLTGPEFAALARQNCQPVAPGQRHALGGFLVGFDPRCSQRNPQHYVDVMCGLWGRGISTPNQLFAAMDQAGIAVTPAGCRRFIREMCLSPAAQQRASAPMGLFAMSRLLREVCPAMTPRRAVEVAEAQIAAGRCSRRQVVEHMHQLGGGDLSNFRQIEAGL